MQTIKTLAFWLFALAFLIVVAFVVGHIYRIAFAGQAIPYLFVAWMILSIAWMIKSIIQRARD
jgi:hypothetical protein